MSFTGAAVDSETAPGGTGAESSVAESRTRHGTLSSSEVLPDLPATRLLGSLDPGDQLDLYRIPIDANTTFIQIHLDAVAPSTELPARVWMIDNSGHVVGDWRIAPHTRSITVSMSAISALVGDSVVFGISHGDAPESSFPPFSYELTVLRQSAAPSSQLPTTIVPLTSAAGPIVAFVSAAGGSAAASSAASLTTVNIPAEPVATPVPMTAPAALDSSQAVVGPLPARSAGPSGDRLAEGDPVPPLQRLDAARVDLNLIDILPRSSAAPVARPAMATFESDEASLTGAPVLVALRSPGGFPLLAAALTRTSGRVGSESASLLPPFMPVESRVDGGATCGAEPAPAGGCHSTAVPADVASSQGRKARAGRHGSAIVGLNVAAILAFGLLLPDLVAALQVVGLQRGLPRLVRRRGTAGDEPAPRH